MKTIDFKTRTEVVPFRSPEKKDKWVVGIDLGYSGVKGWCSNKYFCFPAYVKAVPDGFSKLTSAADSDILYRNESGKIYYVGQLAYDLADAAHMTDDNEELFGSQRFYTESYIIQSEVSTAIGLMANQYGAPGDKEIVIQAGLPPLHLKKGKSEVQAIFQGRHRFSIKLGKQDWKDFDYEISEKNVFVMPQPLGSLISSSVDRDGRTIPNAMKFFRSSIMVFDPGFGTLDLFNVRNGNVVGSNTDPNGGMRRVFELTCDDIYAVYGIALTVPQLQTRLDTGEIKLGEKSADSRKRTLKSRTYSFENILLENSHKVFDSVVDSLIQVYNIAENYSYILITGGTSDAWMDYIKDAFADADTIKVVAANANDPSISNIYSNARGYFFQRMNTKAA